MARTNQPIFVSDSQRRELLVMSRSQTIQKRYSQRAQVILLSDQGRTLDQIIAACGLSRASVNKWRQRFRSEGLEGLQDRPRSGAPVQITPQQRALVIQKACEKPGGGYTNWSQQRIAEQVGISQGMVHHILRQADLKPHKTHYWCGKSSDPEFEAKMLAIVGLYMDPPENALVLCVDEKTQIQALDRSQPELPLTTGKPKRQTVTYRRNGTVALMAALAVHTGQVIGQPIKANNADTFLRFLKKLDRTYRHVTLHIIVDNLSVHRNKKVAQWLSGKRKIKLHFTPTYSSWLNQIEIWFNILTKDVLKGGIWTSTEQLSAQLVEYIDTYNRERAKPFSWTYDGKPLKK